MARINSYRSSAPPVAICRDQASGRTKRQHTNRHLVDPGFYSGLVFGLVIGVAAFLAGTR